ncbi:MAG: endonuclease NucS domain-containing protein [Pseudomonadota bacterium]
MTEKDFENIICKHPNIIEEGLTLLGQQVYMGGKIIDLLFKDHHGQKLIVELKCGAILRQHIGQVNGLRRDLSFSR